MAPTTVEFLLPDELEGQQAVALVADRLDIEIGRIRTEDKLLLDSFDGRLRKAGLRAERPAGRGGSSTVSLYEPGAPARRADVPAGRPLRVDELPPGPVRDRLAPVLGVRALVPVVRLRSRVHPLAILNGDEKTVVRLAVEHAEAVTPKREPIALPPRLRLTPVLGYDQAFERAAGTLTAALGLPTAKTPLFDEAVTAVGRDPGGVPSKPGIRLTRGTRADEAAGLVLARLADIAEANLEGTLEDLDTEFLHDLRVSVRRARSVLRELRGVHPPAERAHLRTELRWVQALTGPVRDLDVQLMEWDELLTPERREQLEPLRALLARRRAHAFRALTRGLNSRRFGAALAAWRAMASPQPETQDQPRAALPIEAVAADRIRRVYRRMVRDGSKIDDGSPPEALHDLRKRGKELRYLLELFGSLYPDQVVKPMVKALKGLQDVLGRFQDRAVQVELLAGLRDELANAPGGPAALMALGLAVEELREDQLEARAHFAERFAAFAAPEQRAVVRDAFPKL